MLVLTRKVGEAVMIGPGVVVKVVALQGGKIRLGIEAPREVPVHRQEVYDEIHKRQAVSVRR